ncbi:hypothetical protein V6N11_076856 [Hibiscus sabdariffa]|uniref:RNase H type-1 domain-containing protein n=1 Tax=Hibiscus sabdariffa TaxID=183260 RepID=A0ABR2TBH4_9ROSI
MCGGARSIPLHHPPHTRSLVWSYPPPRTIKINFDASFIPATSSSSIGVVAHDSFGLVLDACALMLSGAHSVETTKSYAFTRGIVMDLVNNWRNVIIEGDSISVVKILRSDATDNSIVDVHLVAS